MIFVLITESGRSAVWQAHLNGVQGVGGSNPLAPTIILNQFEENNWKRKVFSVQDAKKNIH
jgi:hypothetical protein